jgi:hypothetical protein
MGGEQEKNQSGSSQVAAQLALEASVPEFWQKRRVYCSLFGQFLGSFGENSRPFFFLFLFLETFFSFPVGHAIVPKMKIDIELRSDHTTETIDMEPNLFARNRKAKVVRA